MNITSKSSFFRKVISTIFNRYYSSPSLTKVTLENGIQTITLSDPKTRNALSIAMMQELINNIKQNEQNQQLRVIVIASEGPVFSAGHNMKELLPESGRELHEKVFNVSSDLMMSIIESPVPIIAKVDGLAAAAGCQLVAQCDMAICTDISKFSTPGAQFGIFCSTPGIPIARSVQKMTALKMLFTGLPITAQEAKESGLVSIVCRKEAINEELKKITTAIIAKSRSVIELGKHFYYRQIQHGIKDAYRLGSTTMVDNINLKDGQEGIKSFIEKRKANWSHTFN
ncbi:hypothetical protein AMK59_5552 [Oryctes borbonicus]|uniref:Enoyl-CoA hydratase domain-containing protein 3, mitochondrial n=1 Tax=Oryctes borbonicus TaxID=1629725 RepID=A0A0T6B3T9_9SCAR|nr:hypothetical protein AMK59_5552 [Oryctes borbonicus]